MNPNEDMAYYDEGEFKKDTEMERKIEGFWINGVDGLSCFMQYYPNGKLKEITYYKNGKRDESNKYYEDGSIKIYTYRPNSHSPLVTNVYSQEGTMISLDEDEI